MHHEYPKWIFHESGASKIVGTIDAHRTAGPGWHESPADIKPHVVITPPAEPTPALSESMVGIADEAAETMRQFYAAPAKLVVDQVMKMDNKDDLDEVRVLEENRPGGPRKTVLTAVATQLAKTVTTIEEAPEVHA